MDELQKLTKWVDAQIRFHTIAKNVAPTATDRLKVAETLTIFLQIKEQMLIFKSECDDEVIASWNRPQGIEKGLDYVNLHKK